MICWLLERALAHEWRQPARSFQIKNKKIEPKQWTTSGKREKTTVLLISPAKNRGRSLFVNRQSVVLMWACPIALFKLCRWWSSRKQQKKPLKLINDWIASNRRKHFFCKAHGSGGGSHGNGSPSKKLLAMDITLHFLDVGFVSPLIFGGRWICLDLATRFWVDQKASSKTVSILKPKTLIGNKQMDLREKYDN